MEITCDFVNQLLYLPERVPDSNGLVGQSLKCTHLFIPLGVIVVFPVVIARQTQPADSNRLRACVLEINDNCSTSESA